MKYVLVSGGVVSGLGKGVTASSIGVILKNCGHRVTSVKIGSYESHTLQLDAAACSVCVYERSLATKSCWCRPILEHRCWNNVTVRTWRSVCVG